MNSYFLEGLLFAKKEKGAMRYTTFVFDFDYTLADATSGIVASANYALEKLGFDIKAEDDIKRTVGHTLKDTFRFLTLNEDENQASLFTQLFKEKADAVMSANTIMFPDTIPILNKLKASGHLTAIVTSKFNYRIKEVLQIHQSSHLIDYIVGFEDVIEPKPSPEGLLKAIAFLSKPKGEVLYVGDSLVDSLTAMNANVDFAAVTTGTTFLDDFSKYPYIAVASNLSELFQQMNSLP